MKEDFVVLQKIYRQRDLEGTSMCVMGLNNYLIKYQEGRNKKSKIT